MSSVGGYFYIKRTGLKQFFFAKIKYMHYVYILKCNNKRLYVGCTSDLKDRIKRHQSGYVNATKNLLPVTLKFYCCFPNKYLAFQFEKYLKSGSGRAFTNKHII
jgi:predicted GIY-YIG superfamily endonuclease